MKDITIAGSGYVGLVTGACLAEMGHMVTFYDINEMVVDAISNGCSPIHEPGLNDLIRRGVEVGRIKATADISIAFERHYDGVATRRPDVVFVCVGTPSVRDSNEVDIRHVLDVARAYRFGTHGGENESLLVLKSTVPPGTCRKVQEMLGDMAEVVSNPEFLAEGRAVKDFMTPDRIVVGAKSENAFRVMREIYNPFVRSGAPILEMSWESAEMAKYASNAHLAVRISLMNELAMVGKMFGADIEDVRRVVGHDRRIGLHFLYAGIGFGGSCFPKDLRALRAAGATMVVNSALLVNEVIRDDFFLRVKRELGDTFCDRKVAVWGLSFKPGTDDVRESPAVELANEILHDGATVKAFDPEARLHIPVLDDKDNYFRMRTAMDCVIDADALLVLTEWPEFRTPDLQIVGRLMRGKVFGDGRNLYDPREVTELGFTYVGVGR